MISSYCGMAHLMSARPETARVSAPSGAPLILISHGMHNESQVRRLASALREEAIEVLAFPCDLKGAARLDRALLQYEAKTCVLLVVPDDQPRTQSWWSRGLVRTVLEPHREQLAAVFAVDFYGSESLTGSFRNPGDYEVLDFSGANYREAVQHLAERAASLAGLTGRQAPRPVTRRRSLGHYTVEAMFEPERPMVEQYAELQRQIEQGELDQRFLYWELSSALRWQQVSELSNYLTAQRSINLLVSRASEIVDHVTRESGSNVFSFINLGVGLGQKDQHLLSHFLTDASRHVAYFPVDDSFAMMQITIRAVQNLLSAYWERLGAFCIVDDFRNTRFVGEAIDGREQQFCDADGRGESTTRLIGLLGGALGNFLERRILRYMADLMRPGDYALLGVEFIAGRSEKELIGNYDDSLNRRFIYGPVGDSRNWPADWEARVRYSCRHDPQFSEIRDSATVIGEAQDNGGSIHLFSATKYERESLEAYLIAHGFEIVRAWMSSEPDPVLGKYLLKRHD